MSLLRILYPSQLSFAKFQQLMEIYKPAGLKIHDYEIVSIGLANHVEQIATFNVKDFEEIAEISVIEPSPS